MTRQNLFFALTSLALMFSFVNANAATELAKVNGTTIGLEDFNKKYEENAKFFQFKTPSKKAVLDDLIKREVAIQEAKKAGLDKDPDVIEKMNTVLYHAFIDKNLQKDFDAIHVSDKEAKEYYEKNPEIRTSHIFVAIPPGGSPEDEKTAFDKIKKIQDEALKDGQMGFAEAAQKFSESAAAPMGGDIDFQTRDKLDPVYYEAAVKLKPGKTSPIIKTKQGFYIVKLTAVRSWGQADKGLAKRQAFEERRAQIFEKFMGKLKSQAKISVKEDLIRN